MLATIVDGAVVLTPLGQGVVAVLGLLAALTAAGLTWLGFRVVRIERAVIASRVPCRRVHWIDVAIAARNRAMGKR